METMRLSFHKLASTLTIVGMIAVVGCSDAEWDAQEQRLEAMVKRRATKQEAIEILGPRFVDHSRGGSNEAALASFLAREPKNKLISIREKVAKWPNVLYYSSQDVMTWVFLDQSNRVVDFTLSAQ